MTCLCKSCDERTLIDVNLPMIQPTKPWTLPLLCNRMLDLCRFSFCTLLLKSAFNVLLCSSRKQSATLSSSLNALEKSQGDLENKLGSMQNQHQQDASRLKVELVQAENRTKNLQKEVLSVCCCLQIGLLLWRTHSLSLSLFHSAVWGHSEPAVRPAAEVWADRAGEAHHQWRARAVQGPSEAAAGAGEEREWTHLLQYVL